MPTPPTHTVGLHFRHYGRGPALVLLHGLLGSGSNWHSLASKTFGPHFSTYALDQRSHGKSPHTDRLDYGALAADVVAFLDKHDLGRVHLLGHSMGGKTAMTLALHHPDRVDRLVVADIAPRAYPPKHLEILEALRAAAPERAGNRKEVDRQLADRIASPAIRQFLLKNLAFDPETKRYGWQLNLDALYREYDNLNEAVTSETPFQRPTLFVRGERSDYIGADDEREIRALFPAAEISTIPAAGHWVHADAPEAFGELVLSFLGAERPAAGRSD